MYSRYSTKQKGHDSGIAMLGPMERTLLGVIVIALTLAAGWGGYELGLSDKETPRERLFTDLQAMFDAERSALQEEKQLTDENLDAIALKLGEMQARLMRLDALGERLVSAGELDSEEFDFDQLPAMGGPETAGGATVDLAAMMAELDLLAASIEDREIKLNILEDFLLHRQLREETRPAGRPVGAGWISSRYGWRKDPFTGKRTLHRGLDFAGKPGADILAMADGVVAWSGSKSGFGKTVEIRHGNGYLTRYAHNRELLVEKGQLVTQGQVIAKMGRSGRATGTHLHFEVIRDGKALDPLKYVKSKREAKDDT